MRSAKLLICVAGLGLVGAIGAGCSQGAADPPPPPQTEVIVASPGPDYVWIGGYWGWSWGHYVWIGDHWDRPAHAHAVWVEPRWEHRGNRYVMTHGYWR
jgi:hypothetical protein